MITTGPSAAARAAVVELCLRLAARGFLAATGGNVALRIDRAHFAVTPSAMDYHAMGPDDVCVVRLGDLQQVRGARAPSVESALHARVLRARPDCVCSIHTHQPVASACALLGVQLDVDAPGERALLGPRVALAGYAPSGTSWLAWKLARALRPDVNAYLLRNHGVLCCGPDIDTAERAVEALESLATRHLRGRIARRAGALPPGCAQRILAALEPSGETLSKAGARPCA